jgi:HAD superfamily hydrolase (TIGR01484 family)
MHLLLDIEGTITNRSGYATSPKLIRALALIEEKGIPVIFCSGRDLRYMANLRKRWGLEPLKGAIAENGCVIAPHPHGIMGAKPDPNAEKLPRTKILKRLEMLQGLIEIDPFKSFIFSVYVPGFMNGRPYTEEELDEVLSFVIDAVSDLECQVVRTSASVEIIPPGVDKGTGISRYCDLSGIELKDVTFICDSNNDLPGAKAVKKGGGRVGVVSNGEEDLKKLADAVSPEETWKGALDLFEKFGIL